MGHKGGKWTGASFTGGAAESAAAVQPGEETAQGDPTSVFKYLLGGSEDEGARLFSGQEAMGTN